MWRVYVLVYVWLYGYLAILKISSLKRMCHDDGNFVLAFVITHIVANVYVFGVDGIDFPHRNCPSSIDFVLLIVYQNNW